ncbi:MAG: DsbC family protein [Porticoccaceae bacterium]
MKLLFSLLAGFLLVQTTAALPLNAEQRDAITSGIESVRPDLELKIIGPAPVAGLYEVQVVNGPVLYVSADGGHFFDGSLFRIEQGSFVDVAGVRLNAERAEKLAAIDTSNMIIYRPDSPSRAVITVFTDIDCGYCRKLHRELDELLDYGIEVRYLAYPRAGIGSDSYRKIATAWCADDPNAALTALKAGEKLPSNVCSDNPVAAHFAMGGLMGVNGTPAIVMEDGSMVPGYQPAASFAAMLGLD